MNNSVTIFFFESGISREAVTQNFIDPYAYIQQDIDLQEILIFLCFQYLSNFGEKLEYKGRVEQEVIGK